MLAATILLLATLPMQLVIANPLNNVKPRNVCPAVDLLVSVLGASTPASVFCSSYLHLSPASTSTVTTYR